MNKLIHAFYFGNIFLGICAVALCIETNLLLHLTLKISPFYLLIFFCTCIYYTMIYVRSAAAKNYTERTIWYRNNLFAIKTILNISVIITIALAIFFFGKNIAAFFLLSPVQFILCITFPLIAGWYTFSPVFFRIKKIRQTGWIKPFIVGMTWAGMVTVYPLLISQVQMGKAGKITLVSFVILLIQNFLFFSINAILFDVRDYRTDSFHRLKTYPVILGIRKTFRFIIFPILILNFAVFFLFQRQQHFSGFQTFIQLIPYLLLAYIILNHRQQRSVLYYLAAVDGLVFLKAFCGITSVLLLKK